MMMVSNVDILEKGTEQDGKLIILNDEVLVDEVSFMCNNLNLSNLPDKVNELKRILDSNDDLFRQWLAQYLVMRRITIKQNFHSLYGAFLVLVGDKKLNEYVKQETIRNVKILLKSDKKHNTSNFGDRQLLKNLGHWLGLITIARNQIIILDDLNIYDLLLEAFYKGQHELLFVIPFVVEVVMASKNSLIFKPTCAWIYQILQVLAEIHRQTDLKLSLKFEIEALFKELNVNFDHIPNDFTLLPDVERMSHMSQQLSGVKLISRPETQVINQTTDFDMMQMPNESAMVEDLFIDFVKPRSNYISVSIIDIEGFTKSMAIFIETVFDQFVDRYVIPNTEFHICCLDIRSGIVELLHRITPERTCKLIEKLVENFLISYLVRNDSRHQLATNLETLMMTWHNTYHQLMKKMQEYTPKWDFIRVVTRVLITNVKEHRFLNPDAYDYFIKNRMVNCAVLDQLFARYVECEDHLIVPFVQILCNLIRLNEMRRPISSYLSNTVQQMNVLHSRANSKDNSLPYAKLIDNRIDEQPQTDNFFRKPQGPQNDFQWKAECILYEWITVYYADVLRGPQLQNAVFDIIQTQGIPLFEENVVKLFKTCIEIVLNISYRLLKQDNSPNTRQECTRYLDPFCDLFCIIVRCGDIVDGNNKVTLLQKIFDAFNEILVYDHDYRQSEFNGFAFYRIYNLMIADFCTNESQLNEIKLPILETFGNALLYIQPKRVPGFAFHWLDIIGNRTFINHLLVNSNDSEITSLIYIRLLVSLLKFLAPYLRNVVISNAIEDLYKGTLRILLIIFHDFPELFCEFYFILCDVIPSNCIQLRNLILSAYPKNMQLPDPFIETFKKIETISEMEIMPKITDDMFDVIPKDVKIQIDNYLSTRKDITFLIDLTNDLKNNSESNMKYNVSLLNSVVLYVGICAINQLKKMQQKISISTISQTANMDIYQNLINSFCSEGRYLLFDSLSHHLRYPNAQTHYFVCILLHLFNDSKDDHIKEQITRVLFERLVSKRPHPWGLLITFIELIRNDTYNFWKYEFVHFTPLIERLFFSVAQSCNVNLSTKYESSNA